MNNNYADKIKNHWLGGLIIISIACISTTWFVAYEILVKPRDFVIEQLTGDKYDRIRLEKEYSNLKKEKDEILSKSVDKNLYYSILDENNDLKSLKLYTKDLEKELNNLKRKQGVNNSEMQTILRSKDSLNLIIKHYNSAKLILSSITALELELDMTEASLFDKLQELTEQKVDYEREKIECEMCKSNNKSGNNEDCLSVCQYAAEEMAKVELLEAEVEHTKKKISNLNERLKILQNKLEIN